MQRVTSLSTLCVLIFLSSTLVVAQTSGKPQPAPAKSATKSAPATASTPAPIKDLPVHKVVLYKNGVGYFEHAGTVNGTQRVTIDFTSPQLNDVLQSLTVLDEGGGHIGGVNYNSTTPLSEQLKALSLGMDDEPTSTELYQALRGQRVEVTGAPGGNITGRLMSIESRPEKLPNDSSDTTIDHFFLTVVATSGAVRVVELTPLITVRPLDTNLQGELDRYLELLSTNHATGLRHLTLNAVGQGQRQLRVSYISEVPVWKCTYRLVFPRENTGNAIMQGWAVVDNTVGADWDNVQLSLVAGAPQSFIQPLSQPLYSRRPEIPISTEAQTTPQTHEAAEVNTIPQANAPVATAMQTANSQAEMMNNQLAAPKPVMGRMRAYGSVGSAGMGNGVKDEAGSSAGYGEGTYRASDALSEGDVTTNAFDDFFQYSITQPVTIHKNESAMVPILQQNLPADHVTLWSEKDPHPLRAVWLNNTSKLTLDTGSFSIFESGEFAGEGLLDPIHPGERRLLSYAADQAIRVKVTARDTKRTFHHLSIKKGVIVETNMDVVGVTYTAVNSADEERVVLIEHPHTNSTWTLEDGLKADEVTPTVYRFKLTVPAHSTANLVVRVHGPEHTSIHLNAQQNDATYLLELGKRVPDALDKIQPVLNAQLEIAKIDESINNAKQDETTASNDEARDRENLTALKGNDAAKRFVDELNRAEDKLQATRKQIADLEAQKKQAVDKLDDLLSHLDYEWDVTAK
jgi:hypothetical protein